MATQKETVDFILEKLEGMNDEYVHTNTSTNTRNSTNDTGVFSTRAVFGEYALYANNKVVALICDDQLFVKIMPASAKLEDICEKSEPYRGAKPYYLVEESQLSQIDGLVRILFDIAKSLPEKKVRKKLLKMKTPTKK